MDDEKKREAIAEDFAKSIERFAVAIYQEGFEAAKEAALELAKKEGSYADLLSELEALKPEDDV